MAAAQGAGAAYGATTSIVGGYTQAKALRDQADIQSQVAQLNNKTLDYQSKISGEQSDDAIKRGGQAANMKAQQARLAEGAARVGVAAQGGDVNGAVAANITGNIESMSAADQAAIKVNAFREAFGYKSQSIAQKGQEDVNTYQAKSSANALNFMAKSSMITGWNNGIAGGLRAAQGVDKNRKPRNPADAGNGDPSNGAYGGPDNGSYGGYA